MILVDGCVCMSAFVTRSPSTIEGRRATKTK